MIALAGGLVASIVVEPDLSTRADPRVLRTRRDVIEAATELFLEHGWGAVTHAEVARRAGYSKATIYAHWPTQLDLVRDSVGRICAASEHPEPTGDLRADLVRELVDFAQDLSRGHLARVLGGVIERAADEPGVDELRQQLNAEGSRSIEAILRDHLEPADVAPTLTLLTGAVFIRVSLQAGPASRAVIADLVDRVLTSTTSHRSG